MALFRQASSFSHWNPVGLMPGQHTAGHHHLYALLNPPLLATSLQTKNQHQRPRNLVKISNLTWESSSLPRNQVGRLVSALGCSGMSCGTTDLDRNPPGMEVLVIIIIIEALRLARAELSSNSPRDPALLCKVVSEFGLSGIAANSDSRSSANEWL